MRARPGDEQQAAAVRLQSIAPLAAFAVPVVLLVVAGVLSASTGDDAAIPWMATASPATALFVAFVDDGRAPGLLALLVTAVASAPLWSLLGMMLARRAHSFASFWRQYAVCCAAWAAVALFLVR